MASQSSTSAAGPQHESEEPTGTTLPPAAFDFISSRIEPCAISADGGSMPFHQLECGHIVVVDGLDTRCGLNCLHVSTWMTQRVSHQVEESMEMNTGRPLYHSLTFSARRPLKPIRPPQTDTQGHDKLFCELCQGIPFSSYNIVQPEHGLRRALGLTRPVIGHFTGAPSWVIKHLLFFLVQNPLCLEISFHTHHLLCGHAVVSENKRPCGSNCRDMPSCPGRKFPTNVKQADIILCNECVSRAELVYQRYINAGGGNAQEEVARHGLPATEDGKGYDNAVTMGQHTSNGLDSGYELESKLKQEEHLLVSRRPDMPGGSTSGGPPTHGANSGKEDAGMNIKMGTTSEKEGVNKDFEMGRGN